MYQTCMVWNTGNSTPLLLIVRGVTVLELQYTAWCISEGSFYRDPQTKVASSPELTVFISVHYRWYIQIKHNSQI